MNNIYNCKLLNVAYSKKVLDEYYTRYYNNFKESVQLNKFITCGSWGIAAQHFLF